MADVDAVLLLGFGGPEGPADVMPFLENVTRGRDVPRDRLEEVARQYEATGGRSPINDECRRLVAALREELARRGPDLPVYWGNRNWDPLLADTLARMAADGARRAVAIATSAYSSYSGCRQYLEDIDRARAAVGAAAPEVEKLPPFWDDPGFLETVAAHCRAAVEALPDGDGSPVHLVFTAHSLPVAMASGCEYVAELKEAASLVAAMAAPGLAWDLAWQSRSGPPSQPWLEPDVRDHLRALAATGRTRVVLVPVGFVADHQEVLFDLDVQAREVADSVGVILGRAACVGAAPRFVAGLRDRIAAHVEGRAPATLATRGPRPFPCAAACCPAPSRRRPAQPA